MIINTFRKNRRAGFTLVELLIVVLIIGALLAIALPLYQNAVRNAAENTVKANLRSIFTAAQVTKTKTGFYPTDMAGMSAEVSGLDGKPTGVTYTFAASGTNYVITAQEGGTDVIGGTGTTDKITYTYAAGASAGEYGTGAAASGGTGGGTN